MASDELPRDRPENRPEDPVGKSVENSPEQPLFRNMVISFFFVMSISILLIASLLLVTHRNQVVITTGDSVHLAKSVLKDIENRLADQLLDYSYWDQAVENLTPDVNAAWADRNVGTYMHTRFNISSSYVLDGQGRAVYGMKEGQRTVEDPARRFRGGFGALVSTARSADPTMAPVPATGLLWDGETAHIVAISVLTTFQKQADLVEVIATDSILIYTRALNSRTLGKITRDYKLKDLRVVPADGKAPSSSLQLIAVDGTTIGHLAWRVEPPADALMFWLTLAICVVFAMFGWTAYYFVGRMQSVSAVLYRAKENAEVALADTERAKDQLLQLATIDQITGLPNRALLMDRVRQAIEHARREHKNVGVIFIDLDRFKHINDTRGHAAGDHLLRQVAERLEQLIRQGDTVARLGGDEFVIILHDVELPSGPETVAVKTVEAFNTPFKIMGKSTILTASLGIAIYPNDGEGVEALLQNADSAMYKSKNQGRNTYHFFTPGLDNQAKHHGRIAERLRHAVDRKEFELHFQPIIDISKNEVVAVEALIRWHDDSLESVAPEELVAVAEDSGFIRSIDSWVLEEACRHVAGWRADLAPALELSVNISGTFIQQPGVIHTVNRSLTTSNLPAEALTIEISENLLVDETTVLNGQIEELAGMGVKLALDDFGTGYSSLGYLRQFRVNMLKIDREFIRDIAHSQGDLNLVSAIIVMAKTLGITVVAEGVETVEQLDLVQAHGGRLIQGFYFSQPLSVGGMADFLARENRKQGCPLQRQPDSHIGDD